METIRQNGTDKMNQSSQENKNVYELTQERLEIIFKEFDNIIVSFSGGKDSGVLLNLCIDYMRKHNIKQKIGVLHLDYEIQYKMTTDYVNRTFERNKDLLEIYHICLPFRVTTCTSMYQPYWRPWDPKLKDAWVRPMPADALTIKDFPELKSDMWDYDFQIYFSQWLHRKKRANRTCCLIGIRTQESYFRWRCIYRSPSSSSYNHLSWTYRLGSDIYNVYPIYDWKTTDIWIANGKFKWDYNTLYDLYYKAGVPLEKQRVASPFISEAIESLSLYKAIDPDTWGKMIGRVNGINFSAIYGATRATARKKITLPEGYTWKKFMYFLLSTLPESARDNYLRHLSVSQKFWKTKGGCLSDKVIQKLIDLGIPIEIAQKSNYKTTKHPVKMDYQDDIDIPEFKELPTYKRMCICILRNDHACKYMGFSPTKEQISQKSRIIKEYKNIWKQ